MLQGYDVVLGPAADEVVEARRLSSPESRGTFDLFTPPTGCL